MEYRTIVADIARLEAQVEVLESRLANLRALRDHYPGDKKAG